VCQVSAEEAVAVRPLIGIGTIDHDHTVEANAGLFEALLSVSSEDREAGTSGTARLGSGGEAAGEAI
jgi:hypothetical protein